MKDTNHFGGGCRKGAGGTGSRGRGPPAELGLFIHGAHQRPMDEQSSLDYSGREACLMAAPATHTDGRGWVARMWETAGVSHISATHPQPCGWVARAAIRHAALTEYFWLDCAPGLRWLAPRRTVWHRLWGFHSGKPHGRGHAKARALAQPHGLDPAQFVGIYSNNISLQIACGLRSGSAVRCFVRT